MQDFTAEPYGKPSWQHKTSATGSVAHRPGRQIAAGAKGPALPHVEHLGKTTVMFVAGSPMPARSCTEPCAGPSSVVDS